MTPFHPLFRQALLRDKEHDKLTPNLLDQFEEMLARLYEFESDDLMIVGQDRQRLQDAIDTFQDTFMPNYRTVRERWAESQLKNIKGRYRSANIIDLIVKTLPVGVLWIWNVLRQAASETGNVVVNIFRRELPAPSIDFTPRPQKPKECDEPDNRDEDQTDDKPDPVID